VDDRFMARPQEATQSVQYGVMGLAKELPLPARPLPCLERFGLLCIHQYNIVGVLD